MTTVFYNDNFTGETSMTEDAFAHRPCDFMNNGAELSFDIKLQKGEIALGPFGTIGVIKRRKKRDLNKEVYLRRQFQILKARLKKQKSK